MYFLNEDPDAENHFLTVWRDYSIRLKELTVGDTTILSAKDAAEDAMYQTVCRTERISASENADIIDDSDVHIPVEVLEQDIRSYVQAQELLDEIGANFHVPVDYIKSTPYFMSFMRDYGKAQKKDFRNLLMEKLPDSLSEKQKEYKIGNLLASLKRQGKIKPDSTNQQTSFWILA